MKKARVTTFYIVCIPYSFTPVFHLTVVSFSSICIISLCVASSVALVLVFIIPGLYSTAHWATFFPAFIMRLPLVCLYLCDFACVCVCVSSHPFWTSMDVPAGVTQKEGHTGFLIHLPSAVRALIFVARRIQPFLSLVDREVEFCVLTN